MARLLENQILTAQTEMLTKIFAGGAGIDRDELASRLIAHREEFDEILLGLISCKGRKLDEDEAGG